MEPYHDGLVAFSKTNNGRNVATLFCRKGRKLRLLLTLRLPEKPFNPQKAIDGSFVTLFGVEIPNSKISGRIEKQNFLFEFELPPLQDLNKGQSEGMSAAGAWRFLFSHDIPKDQFSTHAKLAARNCI